MAQKVVYSLGADAKQLASTLDSLKVKAAELNSAFKSMGTTVAAQVKEQSSAVRSNTKAVGKNIETRKSLSALNRAFNRENSELKRNYKELTDQIQRNTIGLKERQRALESIGRTEKRVADAQRQSAQMWRSREADFESLKRKRVRAEKMPTRFNEDSPAFVPDRPPQVRGRNRTLRQIVQQRENTAVREQKKVQAELKRTEVATARVRKQFNSWFTDNAVSNFAFRIKDIATALVLFNALRGITSAFREGRDFIMQTNQGIENARVGIASTITVAGQYVDTLGKAVSPAQQVALALKEADSLIPQLLEVARTRGLSFDALLQTQTATAGFTKAAGFTPEQTVETIATVAFFSEKLGISQGRIVRTLDNIIKGYRVQQTELGTSLGLNDKIIKQWREKGVLAQELLKLLSGTAEASKKNLENLDGIKNSINATLQLLTMETTDGFYRSMKDSYQLILDGLVALRNSPERLENIKNLFDGIGDRIERTTESLVGLTLSLAEINWAKGLNEVESVLSRTVVPGTMGAILLRMFGMTNPAGLGFLASAGLANMLPDSAFGRGMSQADLNRADAAASTANRATAMTKRGQGGASLDALVAALIIPPKITPQTKFTFAATALGGEDGGGSGGGRGGRGSSSKPPRQMTRQEAFAKAMADERRIREQMLDDDLRFLDRGKNEISVLQAQIKRVEQDLPRASDDEFVELNNRLLGLQDELNAKKAEQLEKEKEITEEAKRQVEQRSKEAEALGDLLKGLRDGAKLGDVLRGIGQRASDNLIDDLAKGLVDGKGGGGGAKALLGPSGTGAIGAMLPTWLQGSGSAPPPGLTGPPAPGTPQTGLGASLTSGLSSLAGGVGGFLSGPSFALGSTAANIAGAFGAKQDEQLAIGAGGAIGAAVGSVVPMIGTFLGAIIGSVGGKLFNDAFINPPIPREIQRRENITEAFKLSQTFPSLALAKNENDSVFPEQGSLIGRVPDGVTRQLRSDLVPLLKDFDSLFGLLNLELDPENRGVLPGRAEKLGLSPEYAISELRQVAQESTDLENGIFNLTNQYLRFAQEGKGAEMTQAQYNDRLASTIKLLTDLPASFNYAAIAGASLMDFGQQQIADFEKLNEIIEDVSNTIETSIPNAVRALAYGGNLRDAISSFSSAFSETTIDRFTEDFAKSALVSGKFAEATILGNEASDLFAAGDTQGAYAKILQAKGLIAQGEADMAPKLAELTPILRLINSPTTGGGGIQLPMFMQPNAGMDPIQRNNELLEENNYLLRNGSGQSGSVATVTNNTSVSISSREISDAEKNAYKRQSSGTRRPNPSLGVRS